MSLVGVAEAAEELRVSPRRVRQMLADGDLLGERVGRAWVIERRALDQVMGRLPPVGRPWRAEAAWAFLELAAGRDIDLSAVDRLRIRRRVDEGVEVNLGRLRARANERRLYAHPSVLEPLQALPGFVGSGVSAAQGYAVDLIARDEAEGYIRASEIDRVIERFALDESSDRPNVILRVVDDHAWPFEVGQSLASEIVVAVDLIESDNERSRRAGFALLEGWS